MRKFTHIPRREPLRIVACTSHFFGEVMLSALYKKFGAGVQCRAWTDNPFGNAEGGRRIWQYEDGREMSDLVPQRVRRLKSQGMDIRCIQKRYNDGEMLKLIETFKPHVLLSGIFHGLFSQEVLDCFAYKFNCHPSGWPSEKPGWLVPEEYRGKEAVETTFRHVEEGIIDQAAIAMHDLIPRVDRGEVFAWSKPVLVSSFIRKIPTQLSPAQRRLLWRDRIRNFLGATSVRVGDLVHTALPYLLGLEDTQPDGVRDRRDLFPDLLTSGGVSDDR